MKITDAYTWPGVSASTGFYEACVQFDGKYWCWTTNDELIRYRKHVEYFAQRCNLKIPDLTGTKKAIFLIENVDLSFEFPAIPQSEICANPFCQRDNDVGYKCCYWCGCTKGNSK